MEDFFDDTKTKNELKRNMAIFDLKLRAVKLKRKLNYLEPKSFIRKIHKIRLDEINRILEILY